MPSYKYDPTEYKLHEVKLERDLERFQRAVDEDPRDASEVQGPALGDVYGTMTDWFKDLWNYMKEDSADLQQISNCLCLCFDNVRSTKYYAHPDVFSDGVYPCRITDANGRVIYDDWEGIRHHLAWMYRELSVVAAHQSVGDWDEIRWDIERLGLEDDVKALIRPKEELERGLPAAETSKSRYPPKFWDGHWDEAMVKATIRTYDFYNGEGFDEDEEEEEDVEDDE
ncbi:hypothetical protein EDD85DRAFT_1028276 [Armillaria nabsnona]|nr:hypothetical protein EDD85DRAFT_1028276 [Armillaria nabsnona]